MHLVETMAYAGERPWHGLGNKLAPQQSIETWKQQAGMDWEIEDSEVRYVAGSNNIGMIHAFPEQKALYRSDTKAPLSVVSKRFKVVQPGEILEFYRDLTACNGFELETAGVLREGRKFWALARIGQSTTLKGRDKVDGYLLLATACDGSLATTAQFTSVRVVCNNTLAIALGESSGAVKVPHRSQFDPEAVKRQLGITVSLWDSFVARMKALVELPVDAGLSSIEHIDYAVKAGAKDEAAIVQEFAAGKIDRATANKRLQNDFDPATAMASYRYFAEKGVFVTPTLNGGRILSYLDEDDHAHDPYLAYIGPGLRKTYVWRVERAAKATREQVAARHAAFKRDASVLSMLQRAGVTIMAGTDAGFLNSFDYPGIGLHDELSLYVKEGMTPAQALVSATVAGPTWFGKGGRYGSVQPGKAADLLLLDRNPLQDINATRAIRTVVLRGTVYDRAALDGMLDGVKRKVAAWNAEDAKAR